MLLIRILTFPTVLAMFSVLYTTSIKAPQLVETANLVLWCVSAWNIDPSGGVTGVQF